MSVDWSNFFSRRTKNITGSQIRQFFALTEKPEVISFAGGFPGNDFFPQKEIAGSLAHLIREDSTQALQYSPTEGSFDLRKVLSAKMSRDGKLCNADSLIITDGSQQGLDLLARILINSGDPVLVEEPAYIGGMSAFKSYGGITVGIEMDDEGPLPWSLEQAVKKHSSDGKRPKLFYTVPNFHNPTGITTSLKRRFEILAIASRYNLAIIEDNPYGDLFYDQDVPLSYKALDREDRVIYLGSYSKILIPGIRIGWLAGPGPIVEKISMAKQTADLCSSSLGQQLAYRLSLEGNVDKHIINLRRLYRDKRDAMLSAMDRYFPAGIEYSRPGGGFFIWVNFPSYYPSSRELLEMALQQNVAFVHGEGFSSNGGGLHSARFSFSQPGIDDINFGIKILGEIFWEVEASCSVKVAGWES